MNTQNPDRSDELIQKLLPDFQTDHGGMSLGDLIVIVLDLVLLLYTAYRSWHFLSLSVPAEFAFMALIGLWGLSLGAVSWSLVWMFGSTTPYQDWAAMTMFVVDLLGELITSVVDTISYSNAAALPDVARQIAWFGIPVIIIGNVVAGFIYHMSSPATRRKRARRRMNEEIARKKESGDQKLQKLTLEAEQAQEYTRRRQAALAMMEQIAAQNVQLDGIEKGLQRLLSDDTHVDLTAQETLSRLETAMAAQRKSQQTGEKSPAPFGENGHKK